MFEFRENKPSFRNNYKVLNEVIYISGHYYSSERHPQLMEELQVLDGDIICLQEVGSKYYEKILKPSLLKLGYNGVFVVNIYD